MTNVKMPENAHQVSKIPTPAKLIKMYISYYENENFMELINTLSLKSYKTPRENVIFILNRLSRISKRTYQVPEILASEEEIYIKKINALRTSIEKAFAKKEEEIRRMLAGKAREFYKSLNDNDSCLALEVLWSHVKEVNTYDLAHYESWTTHIESSKSSEYVSISTYSSTWATKVTGSVDVGSREFQVSSTYSESNRLAGY